MAVERLKRPALGARVRATGYMAKPRYGFDEEREWPEDDEWIAGPRWERKPQYVEGIYCGVKRLHQALLGWNEDADADEVYRYLRATEDLAPISVYIVAITHSRRVYVLPGDVEVIADV